MNDPSQNDDKLYIQGLAGSRAEIQIPSLTEVANTVDIAISKAVLSFPVAAEQPTTFDPGERLLLVGIDFVEDTTSSTDEEIERFTFDYLFQTERYGGEYNASTNSYEFDVTREVQAIIERAQAGDPSNYGWRLTRELYFVSSSANVPSETVLEGSDDIRLTLYLTNINQE